MSEDCLYLNIWIPKKLALELSSNGRGIKKLPVFAYLHGGSFIVGGGTSTVVNGTSFTSRDTILVTMNYRLGTFGFWKHKELSKLNPDMPTNFGLLDQVNFFEWIHEYIGYFGGDKDSVTAFGESAGAISILHHLTSKRFLDNSKPKLFHKAILSNTVITSHEFLQLENAEKIGAQLAKDFGCVSDENVIECMRSLEPEKLVPDSYTRWSAFDEEMTKQLVFPAVDHNFPDIMESLKSGKFAKDIPLIMGTSLDEGTLFTWFTFPVYGPERDFLEVILDKSFPGNKDEILERYKEVGDPWSIYSEVLGDVIWQCPNNKAIEWLASKSNSQIRKYVFGYQTKFSQEVFGVFHCMEITFIFENPSGAYLWPTVFTDEEKDLAKKVADLWIDFGKGLLTEEQWPIYDNRQLYLQIGLNDSTEIRLNNSFKKDTCNFWFNEYPDGLKEFPKGLLLHEGIVSRTINELFWKIPKYMWILEDNNIRIIAIISLILLFWFLYSKLFKRKNLKQKLQ